MPYFIAIQKKANVHTAVTKFNLDELVQVDLTRDQVFSVYDSLQEIRLYIDSKQAAEESIKKYYLEKKPNHPEGLFFENNSFGRSSDARLLSIYGENAVYSRLKPVTIIYQVKVNDESIIQKNMEGQLIVNKENKKEIELQYAIVGGIKIYATNEFANQEKMPSATINVIDHDKLTHKPKCRIL